MLIGARSAGSRSGFFLCRLSVGLVRDREKAVFPFLRNGAVLDHLCGYFFLGNEFRGWRDGERRIRFFSYCPSQRFRRISWETHCPRDRQRRGHALLQHVFDLLDGKEPLLVDAGGGNAIFTGLERAGGGHPALRHPSRVPDPLPHRSSFRDDLDYPACCPEHPGGSYEGTFTLYCHG